MARNWKKTFKICKRATTIWDPSLFHMGALSSLLINFLPVRSQRKKVETLILTAAQSFAGKTTPNVMLSYTNDFVALG
jgi:hypothetical protein